MALIPTATDRGVHVSQRASNAAGQQGERHRAAPGETERPAAAHGQLERHQPADG